ncbi:hypothetical protein AB0P15_37310 [Streptomyces sp. NPDC087917]|uniref:hypothetical protein n=1 Tax=Streptomyces sp. NPDC087917 TaxID=3155060 RepID=UPI003429C4B6
MLKPENRAVVDPEIPEKDRKVLLSVDGALLPSADGDRRPGPTAGEVRRRQRAEERVRNPKKQQDNTLGPVGSGCLSIVLGTFVIPFAQWGSWWGVALGATGSAVALLFSIAEIMGRRDETRHRRTAVHYRNRYVCPCDLEQQQRRLLVRAATAVDTVLTSQANKRQLIDETRNQVELPQMLWKIAQDVAEIDRLVLKHQFSAAGSAGGDVDAALATREAAIKVSRDAVETRVKALERYAAKVLRLDTLWAQQQQLEALDADSEEYFSLVARTVEDNLTVERLRASENEATEMAGPLHEAVLSARQAAELVLPDQFRGAQQ